MGRLRVFIDFGSTFTKACAFDVEACTLEGWAKAPSTVESDVTEGLRECLGELGRQVRLSSEDISGARACSSAAGGLRAACIGLTPELTTRAAEIAAYGAGAKLVGAYSRRLTEKALLELEQLRPDIVILAGGTDGGNRKTITENARMLAGAGDGIATVIAAGNKSARDDIEAAFAGSGKELRFTGNIMPSLGELDTAELSGCVREIFLERITVSKGVDRARELIGGVIMPTPSAVLEAARLLADGVPGSEPGLGELMMVDLGGATTDVYSVCSGAPRTPGVNLSGLHEPRVKRTVEGDLGLYHNLDRLCAAARERGIELQADAQARLRAGRGVPDGEGLRREHAGLARLAVRLAAERHCGRLFPLFTGGGTVRMQRGKDLTGVPVLIGAGGPLAFSEVPGTVLSGAVRQPEDTELLLPERPELRLDSRYILFAAGLLAQELPGAALGIMKRYIVPLSG